MSSSRKPEGQAFCSRSHMGPLGVILVNCRRFWTSATLSRVKSSNSHSGFFGAAILVTVDAFGHIWAIV